MFYIVQFLEKEINYYENYVIIIDTKIIFKLVQARDKILQLEIKFKFVMHLKQYLSNKIFDLNNVDNIIDYNVKAGIYEILLLNNLYLSKYQNILVFSLKYY